MKRVHNTVGPSQIVNSIVYISNVLHAKHNFVHHNDD